MTVAEDPVSLTERTDKGARVKNRLEKGGDGELGELHFEFARNFRRNFEVAVSVLKKKWIGRRSECRREG